MLHDRTTRHINIVSDSWGLCDLFEGLDQQAATNQELQLMAVAGMSFFVASGDDGASDCHRLGFNGLAVDDPAGQPYATGVGGTTLHTRPVQRDRLGRPRRDQRRRWRRRLERLPHAVVAGRPRRDPDRPVEQDEVRRQDRVLPSGARHRLQRQPEHRAT